MIERLDCNNCNTGWLNWHNYNIGDQNHTKSSRRRWLGLVCLRLVGWERSPKTWNNFLTWNSMWGGLWGQIWLSQHGDLYCLFLLEFLSWHLGKEHNVWHDEHECAYALFVSLLTPFAICLFTKLGVLNKQCHLLSWPMLTLIIPNLGQHYFIIKIKVLVDEIEGANCKYLMKSSYILCNYPNP